MAYSRELKPQQSETTGCTKAAKKAVHDGCGCHIGDFCCGCALVKVKELKKRERMPPLYQDAGWK